MQRLRIIVALLATIAAGSAAAQGNGNGNGAAVGKGGFLLNIHAYDQCPSGAFLDSNRHHIAVQNGATGKGADKTVKINKIFLRKGLDFWVQDGNACDNGAYFYLPIDESNCSNCDVADGELLAPTFTQYEVRARILGQPGGSVTATSCLETADDELVLDDDAEPDIFCSVGEGNIWVATRIVGSGKEQNRWENVSTQLLTVCVDTNLDLACDDRIGLFDESGLDYWWNWDAQGGAHVQLVFFPVNSGI
jgi:hypothetical protein